MISFLKEDTHLGVSYKCMFVGKSLGYLHLEKDNYYYFYPNHVQGMMWASFLLKEVAFKLEALNEAQVQKELKEAMTEPEVMFSEPCCPSQDIDNSPAHTD